MFLSDGVGLEARALRKLVLKCPSLLTLSKTAKLEHNVEYLVSKVGIPRTSLSRVIEKAPSLLALSTSNNLQPIIDFLTDPQGLAIGRAKVGAMVAQQPQILMSSLEHKLKPCVAFLQEELSLSVSQASKVVQGSPSLLGFSVSANLQGKVDFYSTVLGVTRAQVGSMLFKFPTLLSLSIKGNVKLKLRYMLRYMHVDKQVIVTSPQLLAYSLRNRIYPRFLHVNRIGAQGQASLSSLLCMPDKVFYERFPSTYQKPEAYDISLSDVASGMVRSREKADYVTTSGGEGPYTVSPRGTTPQRRGRKSVSTRTKGPNVIPPSASDGQ